MSTIRQYAVAILIAVTSLFTGCAQHQYRVQMIDSPQSNGSVAHDYARVDLTEGTMCGLHGAFWFNGDMVQSCEVTK